MIHAVLEASDLLPVGGDESVGERCGVAVLPRKGDVVVEGPCLVHEALDVVQDGVCPGEDVLLGLVGVASHTLGVRVFLLGLAVTPLPVVVTGSEDDKDATLFYEVDFVCFLGLVLGHVASYAFAILAANLPQVWLAIMSGLVVVIPSCMEMCKT